MASASSVAGSGGSEAGAAGSGGSAAGAGNLIVKKPASPGRERAPGVSVEAIRAATGAPLHAADDVPEVAVA